MLAGYWIFRGSVWNGLTLSDLVLQSYKRGCFLPDQAIPMLMLAMGVAMAFTIDMYAENPRNFLPLLFKISKRTATLYMFGLAGLLNADEKVLSLLIILSVFAFRL